VLSAVEDEDSESKGEITKRPADFMPNVPENCSSDERSNKTQTLAKKDSGQAEFEDSEFSKIYSQESAFELGEKLTILANLSHGGITAAGQKVEVAPRRFMCSFDSADASG